MDSLDKFIKSVGWKFPKGYPDMNDPKDKAMLFELAENFISEKQVLKENESMSVKKLLEFLLHVGVRTLDLNDHYKANTSVTGSNVAIFDAYFENVKFM